MATGNALRTAITVDSFLGDHAADGRDNGAREPLLRPGQVQRSVRRQFNIQTAGRSDIGCQSNDDLHYEAIGEVPAVRANMSRSFGNSIFTCSSIAVVNFAGKKTRRTTSSTLPRPLKPT